RIVASHRERDVEGLCECRRLQTLREAADVANVRLQIIDRLPYDVFTQIDEIRSRGTAGGNRDCRLRAQSRHESHVTLQHGIFEPREVVRLAHHCELQCLPERSTHDCI